MRGNEVGSGDDDLENWASIFAEQVDFVNHQQRHFLDVSTERGIEGGSMNKIFVEQRLEHTSGLL